MKTGRKNFFNMVELALAIGIVAVGLTAVVPLVPISMKTGGDTKANYYTSDVADSINAYVSRKLASDWNLLIQEIPDSKPSPILTDTSNWNASGEGNVYTLAEVAGIDNGIYGIKMASGDQDNITDITGELLIWRDRIGNTTIGENDPVDMGVNKLAGISVEVSVPLSKPYNQRNKHRFYFEVFNQDSTIRSMTEEEFIENNESDIIEREGGEITITQNAKLKITVIASELCAGTSHAPVYLRISVKEPDCEDPQGIEYSPFMGNQYLYSMYKTGYSIDDPGYGYGSYGTSATELVIVALPGDTWELDVPANTTYKINAEYYHNGWTYAKYNSSGNSVGSIENSYWSTNDNQVLTLLDGDNPPEFSVDSLQLTPEECIQNYINENGMVTLNDNQVLYLFELSHTDRGVSGFDMQDMVVLAEITEN